MKKFILSLGFLACAATAQAQTVTISDETSGSPGTQAVTVSYEAGSDLASFSVRIDFDSALLDPQTDTAANPNVDGCLDDLPGTHTGAFTGCNNPFAGAVALTVTDQLSGTVLPTTGVGTITFDVVSGITPGTIIPIEMTFLSATTDTGAALTAGDVTLVDGSITVEIPPGESFYSSTPAIGENVDFGSAVVGQTTADQIIAVSNLQTDGTTTFDITGASGTNGGATIGGTVPGGTATVPADGGATEVDVAFNCAPTARGDQSGTLAIENDSDNAGPSAGYGYTCAGESPNVQIPAGPVSLSGTVPGVDPSDTITVTNPQDGFTSTANNLTATGGAGDTEITVSGGPSNLAPDASFDFTVSCDSSAEGNFSRTIDFAWDDPVGTGTDSIIVNCTVSDTAPIYESDPVPGTTIALSAPFGTQSAPDGLDVRNANPNTAADDLVINSATPSDTAVFSVTVNQPSFPANGTFDGTDDIEVTCTPEGVGTVNGTLTVLTNDPNEPGGGFTYPLSCEGTGEPVSTNPDNGGTLNLGTVPPGTQTPEGTISFTNNTVDQSINVSCTVDAPDGVFTFTPDPIAFTLAGGQNEEAGFQCTPPDISSFTANVSCTTTSGELMPGGEQPRGEEGLNFTVSCSGRPLVIPTMSRWSLVVMSLVLLLVGGLATRRMMA